MKTFFKIWVGIASLAIVSGIAVIIIALATNFSAWRNISTISVKESYEEIQNLDFEIGYGKMIIKEGETFSIEGLNVPEESFESYVTDGTWYIRDSYDDMIEVLGLRFSLRQIFNWDRYYSPTITITIPRGFSADTCRIRVGAGEVSVEAIDAREGEFAVDAGVLRIRELTITDKSSYEVGTGEMIISNLTANETRVKCGIGYIKFNGILNGFNDIECGIGRVDLNLEGSREDYSYDVSAAIGSVRIDGRHYYRLDRNKNSENEFRLHCKIGSISIDFH